MTINEVFKNQKLLAKATGSSAFGKYQIIQNTLKDAVKELKIPQDAIFDAELQDRIAEHLLEKRGLKEFRSGKLPAKDFLRRVSQEWASVPTTVGGNSYYAGDRIGNKSSRAGNELAKFLTG
jgi:muramidase (phage lysozyme)